MEINECSAEVWDNFVDQSPQGIILNKSFVLNSYALPVVYLMCKKGDEHVAGLAFVQGPEGIKLLPHQHVNGIIFKDLKGLKQYTRNETIFYVLEAFALYLFERYPLVGFNFHWDISDMRAFDWVNYHERSKGYYETTVKYTSFVDISNPTDTSEYAHKRRIPELKKGIKEGHVYHTRETKDIDLLNRLVGMNFERQGIDRTENQIKYLYQICENLLKHSAARIFVTSFNEEPTVATCFAFDKHRAYYLFVGTDVKFRDWGVGTKNFYESCLMLNREQQINEIDMVGINSPLRASYKLSFGGRIVPYFCVRKIMP